VLRLAQNRLIGQLQAVWYMFSTNICISWITVLVSGIPKIFQINIFDLKLFFTFGLYKSGKYLIRKKHEP